MAILKFYGTKIASCTRRVATLLHELQVPEIPADDEGFILYESRAICRYIAAKYPASGLIPSDPEAHALFEQLGWPYDDAIINEQLKILDQKLDAYEVILGEHRYLAGEVCSVQPFFFSSLSLLIYDFILIYLVACVDICSP
ncbi:hypothetical protein K438DRAFT_1917908 [Mycena galopus ATCC 62051]|nr:hypothetical protein K438DRAFT_1917908 [Mycena galopus ATCC 62051]